jgi:glycosyltransferase involved in cell wall biosynthesis
MSMVAKKAPETKLMLVGDGPERHDIERLVDRLDLRKNVIITGFRRDVANLLQCSDVVALSSETESAPLTLLEGMSTGLPVVASRVGGVPEIVDHGVNGFLVEPKNPEDMAERLLELIFDSDLRARMGAAARQKVLDKYAADKIVGQYLEVYERLT